MKPRFCGLSCRAVVGPWRNPRDHRLARRALHKGHNCQGPSAHPLTHSARGVHKGERIDPGDYLWPKEWSNTTGIENERKGKKTVPIGIYTPATHLVNDGKVNIPNYIPNQINPVRKNQMSHMRPPWG